MTEVAANKNKQKKGSLIGSIFWLVVFSLLILKLVVFQQVTVVGDSMQPNYQDGELLLVNQIQKTFERGQVVAVYEDRNVAQDANYFTRFNARFFLKRIIGLPGEEVEIIGSKVIIYNQRYPQGAVLNEPYISLQTINQEEKRDFYMPRLTIPANEYFVMGDNRGNSTDSRERGTFPVYSMFGKEAIRFWPVSELSLYEDPAYTFKNQTEEINKQRQFLQNQETGRVGRFFQIQ